MENRGKNRILSRGRDRSVKSANPTPVEAGLQHRERLTLLLVGGGRKASEQTGHIPLPEWSRERGVNKVTTLREQS